MEYDEKLNLRRGKAIKVKKEERYWVQGGIYGDFWKQGYGSNSGIWGNGQDIEGRSVKKCLYYGAPR